MYRGDGGYYFRISNSIREDLYQVTECQFLSIATMATAAEAGWQAGFDEATALWREDDLAAAAAVCRRTLAAHPRAADVTMRLGSVLADAGQPEEAEAMYRAALGVDPEHGLALYNLGSLLDEVTVDL